MKSFIFSKIDINNKKLSKGHKKLVQYISTNYDKAAFMTASKLGEKVGVSESTVVRFATEMGFKGYPELQKELQQNFDQCYQNEQLLHRNKCHYDSLQYHKYRYLLV